MAKCGRFKEEFQKPNVRLRYDLPDDFVLHQWQSTCQVDAFYLFYRFLFLLTFITIAYVALRWAMPVEQRLKSLIFFTNWSFVLCTIYALLGLLVVTKAYIAQNLGDPYAVPDFPCLYRMYWLLQNSSAELSFGVSIAYWSLVNVTENLPVKRWTWSLHVWNSSLLLMDFFITAVPVRILHVYFSLIVGVVYTIFTIVYYHMGGLRPDGKHYIYRMINWREYPTRAFVLCMAGLLFVVVLRVFIFGLFRLRVWIYYKYYAEQGLGENVRRRFVL